MPRLAPRDEWHLQQELDFHPGRLSVHAARLRRKLHLRKLRSKLGVRNFDIDAWMHRHLSSAEPVARMAMRAEQEEAERAHRPSQPDYSNFNLSETPYKHSFLSRLVGGPSDRMTAEEAWVSSYMGRTLRPYIWRDSISRPPRLALLLELAARTHHRRGSGEYQPGSIDYCYFQRCHLEQVNTLLDLRFWPGIDMTEALLYPDFTVVAVYKRVVVGCAFMTPEAYITYVAVAPGWERANIGGFMLYQLIQVASGKDVILHVSANNPAMILYQRFGFKPEQFIVNFYDKYLPEDSMLCKNAFLLRLRR